MVHRYQYPNENGLAFCRCGCEQQTTRHGRRFALFIKGHNPDFGMRKTFNGRHIDRGYYRVVYDGHHPRNSHRSIFEHIIIMERQLGRHLTFDEDVHHINGDKLDNRTDNLQLLSHNDHVREHWMTTRRKE